jgi:hypothetical protein
MGDAGRKNDPPKRARDERQDNSKKPSTPLSDDEYEDGDIATPKRDRTGNDDEPL